MSEPVRSIALTMNKPTNQASPMDNQSVPTADLNVDQPDSGFNPKTLASTTQEGEAAEISKLYEKISKSSAPEEIKVSTQTMLKRLERMARTGVYSKEYDIINTYIDWVISFPWNNHAEEILDLNRVKQMLDDNHYGLETVKERIMEYLAVRKLLMDKKDFTAVEKSPVICMVGLQGIGKTTMAKSIAKALNRPFYRISMGAIGSVLEIRGRNKSDDAAEPGQIVKAIVRTGVRNPIILLDELDKASGQSGLLADVMATMLEVLDPEQNTSFRDHYLDYPIDLSEVMFIVSANKIGTFSAALMDRMELIRMPSYSDDEKQVIARDYLLPRVRASTGMTDDQLQFTPDVWPLLLRPLGFDSGIRSLQRIVESMARKAALQIVRGDAKVVVISPENFKEYLPKY